MLMYQRAVWSVHKQVATVEMAHLKEWWKIHCCKAILYVKSIMTNQLILDVGVNVKHVLTGTK